MPSLIVRWFFPAHCGECLISAYSARQRNCKSRSPLTDSEETSTRKKRQLTRADPAFGCSKDRGAAIVAEVLHETRQWRRAAQALKIARADVELTAAAFSESDAVPS